jgi:hypothetical protein
MAGGQVLVCLLIWLRLELARQAASGIHRAWPIYSINTVVLHTKINSTRIDLFCPTLQGVDLIFDQGVDLNLLKSLV